MVVWQRCDLRPEFQAKEHLFHYIFYCKTIIKAYVPFALFKAFSGRWKYVGIVPFFASSTHEDKKWRIPRVESRLGCACAGRWRREFWVRVDEKRWKERKRVKEIKNRNIDIRKSGKWRPKPEKSWHRKRWNGKLRQIWNVIVILGFHPYRFIFDWTKVLKKN